jgi:tRNA(fMet)-specific endonuclease VapC
VNYILDTNIVSALIATNPQVHQKLREAFDTPQTVFISALTYYEIKRGLLHKNALQKMSTFTKLCEDFVIVGVDPTAIPEKAAEIHADLRKRGLTIQDVDILIAATALTRNLTVVTDDAGLGYVRDVRVENWLRE